MKDVLALAAANEEEAAQLARVSPEARAEARGAVVTTKKISETLTAEISQGVESGAVAARLKLELAKRPIPGIDAEDPQTISALVLLFSDFAIASVIDRASEIGTGEVHTMLSRASAADVRAFTLRQQAERLRSIVKDAGDKPEAEKSEP